jgi:6-phosphogluconolactonase
VADRPCVHRTVDPIGHAGALIADALSTATRLAIPGGYALAALGEAKRRVSPAVFRRTLVTWVDERCVPFDHAGSNRGLAHREGFLDRDQPQLALYEDGEEPADAAARVEREIDAKLGGAIDVALLGMGDDGHIASLFPGRWHHSGRASFVLDSPKPPPRRITLTRPFLATARTSVLVAAGEKKRAALERLARGDDTLPAAGLPNLQLVTDLDLGAT